MNKCMSYFFSLVSCICICCPQGISGQVVKALPVNGDMNINPDTHLTLTFTSTPVIGTHGKIRVFDAANDKLVDMLDLSIPAGPVKTVNQKKNVQPYTTVPYKYISDNFTNANTKPGTPSGTAMTNTDSFQLNIIGRFTDGFHFYPVIVHDKTATIYLHNNLLQYNKTYYVQIDSSVLALENGNFKGIEGKNWSFTTKMSTPLLNSEKLVVSADGTGDFNTIQGAIDFIPDYYPKQVTISIKKGLYEELVYFRNKTNVTFLGEDRDKVLVYYANNEVFNPHPSNVSTNEFPGTFPSRRAAFACDNSSGMKFINFTIKTTLKGQAEGFLIMGKENILSHMNIVGSGDALQANGSVYLDQCTIDGDGDTYLGRGPAFFNQCRFNSKGAFMWIRNTSANHGAVLLNCELINNSNTETVIARAPGKNGKGYPDCESVIINCKLKGISPIGWGPVDEPSNIHYWEYNSLNFNDGKPLDVSQRHAASRQLTSLKDAETIANYSHPSYILNSWTPVMAPAFLEEPKIIHGISDTLMVKVTAIPEPVYQWYQDGQKIAGQTKSVFIIKKMDKNSRGNYAIEVKNSAGSIKSKIFD